MFWRAFLLRLGIPLAQARAKGQALVDSISARAGLNASRRFPLGRKEKCQLHYGSALKSQLVLLESMDALTTIG